MGPNHVVHPSNFLRLSSSGSQEIMMSLKKNKKNKNHLIIFDFSSNSLVLLLIYLACTPYLFTFHNFVVT